MKYSNLACLLTSLASSFGVVRPECVTDLQEDCAGRGHLTAAAVVFGLQAERRDAAR